MFVLRRKFFTALLFGLISFGQAYPMSVAWGAYQKGSTCCCAHTTKSCGCHHEKKVFGGSQKKMSCHQDKRSGYAQESCGTQKTDGVTIDFRSEPFLPSVASIAPAQFVLEGLDDPLSIPQNPKPYPEAPPPRG
jgi:hypothetical protein